MQKIQNSSSKKYDVVPDVKLTKQQESYLRKKFEKHAKAFLWQQLDTTYYIHAGTTILKHTDTACLFNLLASAYKKDNNVVIW